MIGTLNLLDASQIPSKIFLHVSTSLTEIIRLAAMGNPPQAYISSILTKIELKPAPNGKFSIKCVLILSVVIKINLSSSFIAAESSPISEKILELLNEL